MRRVVASYGGGTNSTAGIIYRVQRSLPIDLILFADTGAERPETYSFVRHFSNWLAGKGYPSVTFVAHRETLEQECLSQERLPSKAFGYGSCSDKFKVQPQRRYIKEWRRDGEEIEMLVFYDYGEAYRMENQKPEKNVIKRFPLIENEIDRDGCIAIIKDAGFCQPGKSSCYFCPSMKKREIKALEREHPDLLARALEIERLGMRRVESPDIKGLGRHFS